MKDAILIVLVLTSAGLVAWRLVEHRRRRPFGPAPRRILFPFVGSALSQPALDATLRVARAEHATLVPAFLAQVPMTLPLTAPLPRQCAQAMPLLEAIEQRAARAGVPVDSRIESGRTHRHAMREALAHERYDRVVVAADTAGTDGFDPADVAWLLENAEGEILVLRPAHDRLIRPSARLGSHPWPTTSPADPPIAHHAVPASAAPTGW